ncbi:MAG: hypothetical protein EVA89_31380 [Sandaracinaceae bacterium]|nr:MAG: hypothetical protein EVA89_31380 [Sandaracinaceae bacterium]
MNGGEGVEWTEGDLSISLGRVATAALGGDSLYLVRHRDLASWKLEGDAATPWHEPVSATRRMQLDERYLHVAADPRGVFYVLLADGSVWRRAPGEDLEAISGPDVRVAGHYAHRVGFVHDETANQLVIAGGDNRNDTCALDLTTRTLVPLPYGPGHGVGQTVATPHGVYRLTEDELWLLRGRDWALVERHEHARRDQGVLLFWSPGDDALFFVSETLSHREPPLCVELTSDGANPPITLQGSFSPALEMHGHVAQVEPRGKRLVQTDRLGLHHLPLSSLQLEGGPPTAPIAHQRSVVRTPPSHWYREALALRQRDLEAPDLEIGVRDGWMLAATLPVSPHLPLANAGSLVLFSREVPYDYDPWELAFTNAFEARIVDEVYPMTAGGMLLDARPYREVEPIFASRVDTAHDGAAHYARGSKIGGFPALVTGTREDAANAFVSDLRCEDCDARLRFAVQLAWPEWDLISAVLYVYACPFGHSAAAKAQNV